MFLFVFVGLFDLVVGCCECYLYEVVYGFGVIGCEYVGVGFVGL